MCGGGSKGWSGDRSQSISGPDRKRRIEEGRKIKVPPAGRMSGLCVRAV